jgi:hypothetical protein
VGRSLGLDSGALGRGKKGWWVAVRVELEGWLSCLLRRCIIFFPLPSLLR